MLAEMKLNIKKQLFKSSFLTEGTSDKKNPHNTKKNPFSANAQLVIS